MNILIYTTPTCPYCRQAKEYLKSKQIPYTERDVTADSSAADEMVKRSGQRGVPVLIIDGEMVIGFDRHRIDEALANASSGRPQLGAAVADASQMGPKHGLGISQGAYVGRVNPGSVAERAGLRVGDVILELDGRSVGDTAALQPIIETLSSGARVETEVWRDGRRIRLQMTF